MKTKINSRSRKNKNKASAASLKKELRSIVKNAHRDGINVSDLQTLNTISNVLSNKYLPHVVRAKKIKSYYQELSSQGKDIGEDLVTGYQSNITLRFSSARGLDTRKSRKLSKIDNELHSFSREYDLISLERRISTSWERKNIVENNTPLTVKGPSPQHKVPERKQAYDDGLSVHTIAPVLTEKEVISQSTAQEESVDSHYTNSRSNLVSMRAKPFSLKPQVEKDVTRRKYSFAQMGITLWQTVGAIALAGAMFMGGYIFGNKASEGYEEIYSQQRSHAQSLEAAVHQRDESISAFQTSETALKTELDYTKKQKDALLTLVKVYDDKKAEDLAKQEKIEAEGTLVHAIMGNNKKDFPSYPVVHSTIYNGVMMYPRPIENMPAGGYDFVDTKAEFMQVMNALGTAYDGADATSNDFENLIKKIGLPANSAREFEQAGIVTNCDRAARCMMKYTNSLLDEDPELRGIVRFEDKNGYVRIIGNKDRIKEVKGS